MLWIIFIELNGFGQGDPYVWTGNMDYGDKDSTAFFQEKQLWFFP
ncbi:hypothetical protein VTP01DRAFT_9470 [Rhizomucor pusillus]